MRGPGFFELGNVPLGGVVGTHVRHFLLFGLPGRSKMGFREGIQK